MIGDTTWKPGVLGLVANTKSPLPVSSVTAAARFALLGTARNVATPAPSPLTPVEIGKFVQLDKSPDAGVDKAIPVGIVVDNEGTPPALVTSIELLAVVRPLMVSPAAA